MRGAGFLVFSCCFVRSLCARGHILLQPTPLFVIFPTCLGCGSSERAAIRTASRIYRPSGTIRLEALRRTVASVVIEWNVGCFSAHYSWFGCKSRAREGMFSIADSCTLASASQCALPTLYCLRNCAQRFRSKSSCTNCVDVSNEGESGHLFHPFLFIWLDDRPGYSRSRSCKG